MNLYHVETSKKIGVRNDRSPWEWTPTMQKRARRLTFRMIIDFQKEFVPSKNEQEDLFSEW